jgi:hypothetical protein
MPKWPAEPIPTLNRSDSRIVLAPRMDEFVVEALVIPLVVIVLDVFPSRRSEDDAYLAE